PASRSDHRREEAAARPNHTELHRPDDRNNYRSRRGRAGRVDQAELRGISSFHGSAGPMESRSVSIHGIADEYQLGAHALWSAQTRANANDLRQDTSDAALLAARAGYGRALPCG